MSPRGGVGVEAARIVLVVVVLLMLDEAVLWLAPQPASQAQTARQKRAGCGRIRWPWLVSLGLVVPGGERRAQRRRSSALAVRTTAIWPELSVSMRPAEPGSVSGRVSDGSVTRSCAG